MSRRLIPSAETAHFACEAAGLMGIIATLLACMLAFAGAGGSMFWITIAVAGVGALAYLTYQITHALTGGGQALGWRARVLAIFPVALALGVIVLLGGQRAGLFHVPVGHREMETKKQVISVKKNADGTVTTSTHAADSD